MPRREQSVLSCRIWAAKLRHKHVALFAAFPRWPWSRLVMCWADSPSQCFVAFLKSPVPRRASILACCRTNKTRLYIAKLTVSLLEEAGVTCRSVRSSGGPRTGP